MDRLKDIQIKKTLALGTIKVLTAREVLAYMTDEQVKIMFEKNLQTQYILLDYGRDLK